MAVALDLHADPIALTAALVDIPSESRHEQRIADEVEAALRAQTAGFEVVRNGDAVLARTNFGRPSRVLLAGHIDTVPAADNLPSRLVDGDPARLRHLGHEVRRRGVPAPGRHRRRTRARHHAGDVRLRGDRVDAPTGSAASSANCPTGCDADVAILGEPSGGFIEAGCQGTIRVVVSATGTRAHSARSWLGDNAIHKLGAVLDRLSTYQPRNVDIDGCTYREGLSAVRIDGGIAGNVIPDAAIGHGQLPLRARPQRRAGATRTCTRCSTGSTSTIELTDAAAGALPGLTRPAAAALVEAAGGQVRAKYGWTDVARFAALGIPAVNYGPGDPNLAHRVDERVEVAQITAATEMLRHYL